MGRGISSISARGLARGKVTWKEHAEGTVIWIHGGAFAFRSPRVYRAAAVHLARATRCRVILPQYRLAPTHVFPTAHDDVERALGACVGHTVKSWCWATVPEAIWRSLLAIGGLDWAETPNTSQGWRCSVLGVICGRRRLPSMRTGWPTVRSTMRTLSNTVECICQATTPRTRA